ncbi:MAG: bifunctional 4-hydroxy-3-methylbut-2-enyl diphosphate reductase/30S ribosomal protein S1 [Tissierellia bacterium]|nr:bifunctional 4-hydroxy-3-methylbut-2-enyl diphosphate reductase/30S ribosomal protein S1 [Tissierellia bacterium]
MRVEIAKHAGFCFGVKSAVQKTEESLKGDLPVYTDGELVHNRHVTQSMESQGLKDVETKPEGTTGRFIVRSHGLAKSAKDAYAKRGLELVDCTCPVLMKMYQNIEKYENEGYRLILVGDPNHPEILGLLGHSAGGARVVSNVEEAQEIKGEEKLIVFSQTTNIQEKFDEISGIMKDNNTQVVVANTICGATKMRQKACIELARRVDAMIVIGGLNSSNTNKLYTLATEHCPKVFRIESKEDLDFRELIQYNSIGITAGASTPGWIIEEVAGRMENLTKEEFMEQVEGSFTNYANKDIVKGTVLYVTDDEVSVNINYRSDGIISLDEISTDPNVKPKDLFHEGQEIEVYIIKLEDAQGNVVLSTRRVEGLKNWQKLLDAYEGDEKVTVTINKEVKGGLLGSVMGITAFLPGSHIASRYERDLAQFIGQEIDCKIISADDKKRRLVVSRKKIEEEEQQKKMDAVWETIEVDKVMEGTVARLTDFGAFVDLGGVDGLIHVSDISWNRIKHPSEVLNVNDVINVIVLRKNREKNRISLGYKQLQEKPFELFMKNNNEGDVVKGTIVNLVDFGAFVRLKEGVEGLVHVSQISDEHVEKPSDELNIDQEVDVKILEINPESRKIALSIKATKESTKSESPRPEREFRPKRERRSFNTSEIEGFKNQELDTSIGALIDFDFTEED